MTLRSRTTPERGADAPGRASRRTRRARRRPLGAVLVVLVLGVVLVPAVTTPPAAVAADWTPVTDLGAGAVGGFDVAVNSSGQAVAAWTDGSAVLVARRRAGEPWSAPENIGTALEASNSLGVSVLLGEDGRVHVFWGLQGAFTTPTVNGSFRSRTMAPDGTWAPLSTYDAPTPMFDFSAAVTTDGTAVVRWLTFGRGYAATVSPAGAWGPYTEMRENANGYVLTGAVFTEGRAATVVWTTGTSPGSTHTRTWRNGAWDLTDVQVDAQGGTLARRAVNRAGWVVLTTSDSSRITVRFRSPGGGWQTPVAIPVQGSVTPSVTIDDSGRAVLAWREGTADALTIRATQVDPLSGPGTVTTLASAASLSLPEVVTSPTGSPTVAWRTSSSVATRSLLAGGWSPVHSLGAAAPVSTSDVRAPVSATAANGDAVLAWVSATGRVVATTFDATAPEIATLGWSGGFTGEPISFRASATDVWSAGTYATWDFGDGGSGEGYSPTHTYAETGTYPVTLTVTDTAGNTATRRANVTVGRREPPPTVPYVAKLSHFDLNTHKLRLKGPRSKRSTTARIGLDGTGRVTLSWTMKVTRTKNGKKRTKIRTVARQTYDLTPGTNKVTLTTKVGGKKLKVGKYVLVATIGESKRTAKLRIVR